MIHSHRTSFLAPSKRQRESYRDICFPRQRHATTPTTVSRRHPSRSSPRASQWRRPNYIFTARSTIRSRHVADANLGTQSARQVTLEFEAPLCTVSCYQRPGSPEDGVLHKTLRGLASTALSHLPLRMYGMHPHGVNCSTRLASRSTGQVNTASAVQRQEDGAGEGLATRSGGTISGWYDTILGRVVERESRDGLVPCRRVRFPPRQGPSPDHPVATGSRVVPNNRDEALHLLNDPLSLALVVTSCRVTRVDPDSACTYTFLRGTFDME
jgi:hypothetical protein